MSTEQARGVVGAVVEPVFGTLAARVPERREALDRRLAYVTPAS